MEEVAWGDDKEGTQLVEGKRSGRLLACSEASISGDPTASRLPSPPPAPARAGPSSRPGAQRGGPGEAGGFAGGFRGAGFQGRGSSKCQKAEFVLFLFCLGPAW